MGLETGMDLDLEEERKRRASVLSLFSFSLFSSIQVWMSEKQVSREDIQYSVECSVKLTVICKRLALSQVRKRFCEKDEEKLAQHRALWDTIGKSRYL